MPIAATFRFWTMLCKRRSPVEWERRVLVGTAACGGSRNAPGVRRGVTPLATHCRTATNLAAARAPLTYSRAATPRRAPPADFLRDTGHHRPGTVWIITYVMNFHRSSYWTCLYAAATEFVSEEATEAFAIKPLYQIVLGWSHIGFTYLGSRHQRVMNKKRMAL